MTKTQLRQCRSRHPSIKVLIEEQNQELRRLEEAVVMKRQKNRRRRQLQITGGRELQKRQHRTVSQGQR